MREIDFAALPFIACSPALVGLLVMLPSLAFWLLV
jgi:hypothetical protein